MVSMSKKKRNSILSGDVQISHNSIYLDGESKSHQGSDRAHSYTQKQPINSPSSSFLQCILSIDSILSLLTIPLVYFIYSLYPILSSISILVYGVGTVWSLWSLCMERTHRNKYNQCAGTYACYRLFMICVGIVVLFASLLKPGDGEVKKNVTFAEMRVLARGGTAVYFLGYILYLGITAKRVSEVVNRGVTEEQKSLSYNLTH